MTERFLTFDCQGDVLVGLLHEPVACTARDTAVLIVVGGPQYRVGSHRQFVLMARDLAAAGYPVLRFDYRGMGDSSGGRRSFYQVDDDIRAGIGALQENVPHINGVVIFGLCDAASAALIYCATGDSRVQGLILANPWVRTEMGEARAYVRHYYVQRVLQGSFWEKLLRGEVNVAGALNSLFDALKKSLRPQTLDVARVGDERFTQRMLVGFKRFDGAVLLLQSGRDLTAREFDDFCRKSRAWTPLLASAKVRRIDLPQADHTFSSADSLRAASGAMIEWLAAFR